MGPAIFVMAILGCGEGEASCQPVQIADTRFESREACLAATDGTLARFSNLDFPVILAECRAAGAPVAEGEQTWESLTRSSTR